MGTFSKTFSPGLVQLGAKLKPLPPSDDYITFEDDTEPLTFEGDLEYIIFELIEN